MLARTCVTLALICAGPASAAAPALSPSDTAQLAANLARGDLIYAYDQSAWHVTDAAMATLPEIIKASLKGYISTPAPTGVRTTFFREDGAGYFAVYSAVWTGKRIADAQVITGSAPVSAEERRLIDARKVAIRAAEGAPLCGSASINSVVVPGATPAAPISVYLLSPQTDPATFPLGGHHRFDVQEGKVIAQRAFTRSCIDLKVKGGSAVANAVSHILDKLPTEIHAFAVHSTRMPLGVGVDGRVFYIQLSNGHAVADVH